MAKKLTELERIEIDAEDRYRTGYSQSVVNVRILVLGGADDLLLKRYEQLIYQWRLFGQKYTEHLSNMTAGCPEEYVFNRDKLLMETYNAGLEVYNQINRKK